MLIGIEMIGDQGSPANEGETARFTHELVAALLAQDEDNHYFLYYQESPPASAFPEGPMCTVRVLRSFASRSISLEQLTRINPDRLDVLLLTSPLLGLPGHAPPVKPLNALKIASVMYNLALVEFLEDYHQDGAGWYASHLRTLRQYDGLLAVSASIMSACEAVLGLSKERIFNIGPGDQSQNFSWESTAHAARKALETIMAGPVKAPVPSWSPPAAKPRIAFFSPFSPQKTGVSDYSTSLLAELKRHYTIDLYHEPGYLPHLGMSSVEFACHDIRLFDHQAAILDYHALVYQMGNSHYHRFIYETLLRHPGIVTLHDSALIGFHHWYASQPGVEANHFRKELAYNLPGQPDGYLASLVDKPDAWAIQAGLLQKRIHLNRRILEYASAVVVHDEWNRNEIEASNPEYADRVVVIPQGTPLSNPASIDPGVIRARFDLPAEALLVASFGILSPSKLNEEALDAFAALANANRSVLFVFVGADWTGQAQAKVASLGLEQRVRFLGHQPMTDFINLAAITDIGINLRRPPTCGETSASLLTLLGAGVAVIVTDVDTFSSYPDNVVVKVPWERGGVPGLKNALLRLAKDRWERKQLGISARQYVRQNHSWSRVGSLYAELIEQFSARRNDSHASAFFPWHEDTLAASMAPLTSSNVTPDYE